MLLAGAPCGTRRRKCPCRQEKRSSGTCDVTIKGVDEIGRNPPAAPATIVRVNAVLFGPIETPQQRAILERTPEVLESRLMHWRTGRFGTLDETADTIAFLAGDDAGFIAASTIPLVGGIGQAFTVPD